MGDTTPHVRGHVVELLLDSPADDVRRIVRIDDPSKGFRRVFSRGDVGEPYASGSSRGGLEVNAQLSDSDAFAAHG